MKNSSDRIQTSHGGSLPRPDDLIEANAKREAGTVDEVAFQKKLTESVADVVRRQVAAGITVPGDGEYGKSMGHKINYRAWWSYSFSRLANLKVKGLGLYDMPAHRSSPGNTVLSSFADRRDRQRFAAAYGDPESGVSTGPRAHDWPFCVGPLSYTGHKAIAADIANFKAALAASGASEGFMTSIGPASCARIGNEHYKSDDEFVFACADAMREEYKAIVEAGLVLQIDCVDLGGRKPPGTTREDVRKDRQQKIDLINHATRGLPAEQIRIHVCWGALEGPHHNDAPLEDFADILLTAHPAGLMLTAANGRHEHEWRVWQDVKVPEGKVIIPGIIDNTTNIIEHPRTVAERIVRFAGVLGRENVIAGVDCGFSSNINIDEVDPDIAFEKLKALVEGAEIASHELWRK